MAALAALVAGAFYVIARRLELRSPDLGVKPT